VPGSRSNRVFARFFFTLRSPNFCPAAPTTRASLGLGFCLYHLTMTTKFSGAVTIDGTEYRWNFKRGPSASYDRLVSHALYVFVADGSGRDLILDFPYGELGTLDKYNDHSAVVEALRECVPLALRAGWNAEKRGKPILLDVASLRRAVRGEEE
jgi:hypothetical protein